MYKKVFYPLVISTDGPSVLFHSGQIKIRKPVIFNNLKKIIPKFIMLYFVWKIKTRVFFRLVLELQQKVKKNYKGDPHDLNGNTRRNTRINRAFDALNKAVSIKSVYKI